MNITLFLRSLSGGGAERVMLNLADGFRKKGHHVEIVLMEKKGELLDYIPKKVKTKSLESEKPWKSLFSFIGYVNEKEPDVVLSAMPIANTISGISNFISQNRYKTILTEHNTRSLAFGNVSKKRQKLLIPFIRMGYEMSDILVSVSKGVKKKFSKETYYTRLQQEVINNPVYKDEIEERSSDSVDHKWVNDESQEVVISAGRLNKQKSFSDLLRAFAKVKQKKDAKLIILGEGKERKSLQRNASRLEIEDDVSMPGFIENPWAYISKSDVFVLSSRYEGFGNVLVEAMACGTPVVSTDCPSGPATILADGKYGRLVPVGDPESLSDAVIKTLDSTVPSRMLVQRARQFSVDKAVTKYLKLMEEL